MIELYTIQGELIELDSSEITIELNNSLFNDGSSFKGSASFPVKIAFTPGNLKRLGFAHQLDVKVKQVDIPVYAKAGSKTFRRCLLNLSVGDKSFGGFLKLDITTINDLIKNTKLNEIPFAVDLVGKTKAEIQAQMLLAATNTDWRFLPYTFFPVRNPEFCGDPVPGLGETEPTAMAFSLINSMGFASGSGVFDVEPPGDVAWDGSAWLHKFHVVPFYYLPYVLTGIASWLGVTLKGDFITHRDVARVVVHNVNSTMVSHYGNNAYPSEQQGGIFFAANEHLPAITVTEFFKALVSYFGCSIKLNSNRSELVVNWKKTVFERPTYRDWTKKAFKVIDQQFVVSEGYRLGAEVDKDSSGNTGGADEVVVGGGKDVLSVKAGTLKMTEEQMPNTTESWLIPYDSRPGNIVDPVFRDLPNYRANDSKQEFPLRFIFYNGLDTYGANARSYPRAHYNGDDFSLRMDGDNGLYQFSHKKWLDKTYGTKTIKATVRLNENDINNLQDEDIIQLLSENGSVVNCLWKRLTFTSKPGNAIVVAEAEMLVLDSAHIVKVGNDRGVFVKAEWGNLQFENDIWGSKLTFADVLISVWGDKNCTLPLVPVDLPVWLKLHVEEYLVKDYGTMMESSSSESKVINHRFLMNAHSATLEHQLLVGFEVKVGAQSNVDHLTTRTVAEVQRYPGYVVANVQY